MDVRVVSNKNVIKIIQAEIAKAVSHTVDFLNEANISHKQIKIIIEKTKNPKFGDFTTNVALSIGLKKERAFLFASEIAKRLQNNKYFKTVNAVQPGFINLRISPLLMRRVIGEVLKKKDKFGKSKRNKQTWQIEFVSANPTGLLHIGHARNAAIGDTLANILAACGYDVVREYYINDAGNQIEKLALSVLIRYLNLYDQNITLPEDSYHGSEIIDVAEALKKLFHERYTGLKFDNDHIIVASSQEEILKNEIKRFSKNYLLDLIAETLEKFGVNMDIWFPESFLYKNNIIPSVLEKMKDSIYTADNATWLKTTLYGDDKDRVLIKSDGNYTYFLPDIAYHTIKMSRGYDKTIDIWGADHKSYADRMKIAMQLAGFKKEQLEILIMQMVRLIKNGEEFKMSKRTGNSLTLNDLVEAIGKDPARWYLVSQPMTTHLEIDVDKALSHDNNNPLYYVQYAYARINQIINKTKRKSYSFSKEFSELNNELEHELITYLATYEMTLNKIAQNFEVNILTLYLTNLAKTFHAYYSQVKIIDETNEQISEQRLYLVKAVGQVIANGLKLLTIKPLEKM